MFFFYDLVVSEFLNRDIYKFVIEFFILTLGDWVEVNARIHSFLSIQSSGFITQVGQQP